MNSNFLQDRLPTLVLYLLALLLPFSSFYQLGPPVATGIAPIFAAPLLYLTDLALALALLFGLWRLRRTAWRERRNLPGLSLGVILLLVVLLGGLSIRSARAPDFSAYSTLRWFLGLALFAVIAAWRAPLEQVVLVFILGLGVQAAVGIAQALVQGPLGLPGDMTPPRNAPWAAVIGGGLHWLRAYGLTFHPNVLGGFLTVGLLLGLPLLERGWFRWIWWLLWAALLLTFSRAAWLALALTLPFLAAWLYRHSSALRRSLLASLGVVVVAGLLGGLIFSPQIIARLSLARLNSERASVIGRGLLILVALEQIEQHPWSGIGAGHSPLAAQSSGFPITAHSVHNVPLLLASEVGILGALLWYLLWLAPLFWLLRAAGPPDPWAAALTAAWMALCIIGLWDQYPWALESGRLLGMLLLGLWAGRMASHPV